MGLLRRVLLQDPGDDDSPDTSGSAQEDQFLFTLYICISLFLVCMAGLMSGLTLGLMSLDTVELEVLKRSGTPEERACAVKIMPVIKHQHFLLVTLLLCNAAATEALPLFIDRLADPFTAVVLSVSVVLVFGEIIPQAVCTRYGLKVGAYSAWFVRLLMTICSPIAWPIGKLLDFLLGPDHSALFRRAQLKALVDLHGTGAGFGGTLSEDEVHVIRGALDLTSKVAWKSMTPLDKVFMLSTEDTLDERTLQAILMSGHSRIPVYRDGNRKAIIGLILVKELVLVNPADNVPVSSVRLRELPRLAADTPMYDMLKLFETGKSHMAVLTMAGPAADGGPWSPPPPGVTGEMFEVPHLGPHGGRKQVGTSWPTNPRNAPFRRLPPKSQEPGAAEAAGHGARAGDEYGQGPGVSGAGSEAEPVGIITIEDVIEELLQEEIIDETDLYIDNMQSQRVNAAAVAGSLPPRLRQVLSTGLFTPRVGRLDGGASGTTTAAGGAGSRTLPEYSGGGALPPPAVAGMPSAASAASFRGVGAGGATGTLGATLGAGMGGSSGYAAIPGRSDVELDGSAGPSGAALPPPPANLELRRVEGRASSGLISAAGGLLRGRGAGLGTGGGKEAKGDKDGDARIPLLGDVEAHGDDGPL